MSETATLVELDRLNLIDVDRTLFRSAEFMLALHDALLKIVDVDLPSKEQVVQDISAESLPFVRYYNDKGVQLSTLYIAADTIEDLYVYEDIGVLAELPGRVMLYTKGERDTQEVKLHHSGLSTKAEGQTSYDETSQPGVWIVQTNKGELLKQAIDQDASDANTIVLRWKNAQYRVKELIFVDDKYGEIRPLVDLSRSGLPLYLAQIVRKDTKYGAANDRDTTVVVQIETLSDLEARLQEMRNTRKLNSI